MDGGDYQEETRATPARVAASLLSAIWIALVFKEFGINRATGMGIVFLLALAMIWFPSVIARLPTSRQLRDSGATGPVSPAAVRVLGWLVILGLPTVWLLFTQTYSL